MPIWSFRRCRLVGWGWLFRKGRQKGSSVSYLDEKKMKTQDFYTYTVMIFFKLLVITKLQRRFILSLFLLSTRSSAARARLSAARGVLTRVVCVFSFQLTILSCFKFSICTTCSKRVELLRAVAPCPGIPSRVSKVRVIAFPKLVVVNRCAL
jgi:hypothetical protein